MCHGGGEDVEQVDGRTADEDERGRRGRLPVTDGGGSPVALTREYYRALDEQDYERLKAILEPDFVHERPDRTIENRDAFVRFMRDDRPQTDTSHQVDATYVPSDESADSGDGSETAVVARGRLLAADGSQITGFVDVFTVCAGALCDLRTYTH